MRKGPGSAYDKWSFVTYIFHNGQSSHGDNSKTLKFEIL